jgi:hypothetical protein
MSSSPQAIRMTALTNFKPLLTLILCSRNDNYMGNSRWRLQTTLNYIAEQLQQMGRDSDVEVLVTDWGSQEPLSQSIELTPTARRITSFVLVPPDVAQPAQKDSPFPEVLALNVAVRHSRGDYVGRVDQDTLIGSEFFKFFFDFVSGKKDPGSERERLLFYANRKNIPYWFSVRCLNLRQVSWLITIFKRFLKVARQRTKPFWSYWVGIWLLPRAAWFDCGGYNERLLYYNWMETEMILRLRPKYEVFDLGPVVDYCFYHLDHANPRIRKPRHPVANQDLDFTQPIEEFHPNDSDWGLNLVSLKKTSGDKELLVENGKSLKNLISFSWTVIVVFTNLTIDFVWVTIPRWFRKRVISRIEPWLYRVRKLRETVRGQPLLRWPGLVIELKRARKT